jgi:hypothetical protein
MAFRIGGANSLFSNRCAIQFLGRRSKEKCHIVPEDSNEDLEVI